MDDKASVITRKHAIYSLVVLFFVNIMNNLDRYLISIVFPLIKTDLSLSDTELGVIGGVAFTVFYAIMAFPMGWAVDRFTRKYVISVGLAVWSAATFLSGLARSFLTLFLARALTGTGESSCQPSGISLLSDYFTPKIRAASIGIFISASSLGGGFAFIFGGMIAEKFGWRSAFFFFAGLGFALLPFILFLKEPIRGIQEGLTAAQSGKLTGQALWPKIRKILSIKTLRFQYVVTALLQIGFQGFAIWFPTFMVRLRGYDLEEAGKVAGSAVLVAGIMGAVGGGIIADRWFRKDKAARLKAQILFCALAIPFMIFCFFVASKTLLVLFLLLNFIFLMALFPISQTLIIDLVDPGDRGSSMALMLFMQSGIGFSLGPLIVGAISDLTGSLLAGLIVLPAFLIMVVLLGFWMLRFFMDDFNAAQKRIASLKEQEP